MKRIDFLREQTECLESSTIKHTIHFVAGDGSNRLLKTLIQILLGKLGI